MVCVWRLVLATFACVATPAPTAKPVATPAPNPPVTAPNCDAAEALAAQSEAARLAAEKERDAAEAARLAAEAALAVAKRERDAAVAARDAAETRATQCESDQTGSILAIRTRRPPASEISISLSSRDARPASRSGARAPRAQILDGAIGGWATRGSIVVSAKCLPEVND